MKPAKLIAAMTEFNEARAQEVKVLNGKLDATRNDLAALQRDFDKSAHARFKAEAESAKRFANETLRSLYSLREAINAAIESAEAEQRACER